MDLLSKRRKLEFRNFLNLTCLPKILNVYFCFQVSTLTGSSEVDAATPLGRDSLGSLASMSLSAASNCSSSSPGSRRHSVTGDYFFYY